MKLVRCDLGGAAQCPTGIAPYGAEDFELSNQRGNTGPES